MSMFRAPSWSNPVHRGDNPLPRLTIYVLQLLLGTDVADGLLQGAIVDGFLFDLGKQVWHDAAEQLQVVLQELWHVDVPDGSQADQLLLGWIQKASLLSLQMKNTAVLNQEGQVLFCLVKSVFENFQKCYINNNNKIRALADSCTYTALHSTNLIHVRVLSFKVSCGRNDSLHSSHPKVIVILQHKSANQLPLKR